MRILLITHFYPPKFNAGTENYTHGLAHAFQQRGHDVCVLCAEGWQEGENYWTGVTEDIFDGVPVNRIHLNWTQASNPNLVLYDSLVIEQWLDGLLNELKPDLVHVTSTHSLGVGILRSVKRFGAPLILTLMDFWFLCPNHQLIRGNGGLCDGKTTAWECQSCLLTSSNFFTRFNSAETYWPEMWNLMARIPVISRQRGLRGMLLDINERKKLLTEALTFPDLILTHSKFVQSLFRQHSIQHVQVLPNGHDMSWQGNYRGKTSADVLRFGYIGQIQPTKGLKVLIEAFNKSNIDAKARLGIWGDASKNQAYMQQLQEIINNNVSISFNGRFDHSRIAEILANIDVLVVPSIWYENAPLVIQEAFAAKTPVIATNLGGMAEAVTHEGNGLLFERNDVDDLVRQMQRIVEEPGLLKRLESGTPRVKTIEEEVVELEEIYQNLLR